MQVKPGCRVRVATKPSDDFNPISDVGTVFEKHMHQHDCWWVDWDDGTRLYLSENEMSPVTTEHQRQVSCDIETAIKLLKENGYVVMKQM